MSETEKPAQKVLIASANPLFARGLEKILRQRWGSQNLEARLTGSMQQALADLGDWRPDLVILDYDDQALNRAEFLNHFINDDRPMQLMLISLQASGAVVVYDRRTLTQAQAGDWLDLP